MSLTGHVVAVRVTSEDANDGFKPTCGSIDELSFRTSPDVWGYFSVKSGGGIHEFSDSQVGHIQQSSKCRSGIPAGLRTAMGSDTALLVISCRPDRTFTSCQTWLNGGISSGAHSSLCYHV